MQFPDEFRPEKLTDWRPAIKRRLRQQSKSFDNGAMAAGEEKTLEAECRCCLRLDGA
jgi:hypothetical protein